MKKQLLFTSFSALFIGASAQITITNGNYIGVGDTVIRAYDQAAEFSNISGGANQTWDFSTLINNGEEIIIGKDMNTLPGASNHPTANFATQLNYGEGDLIDYFRRTADQLELVGYEEFEEVRTYENPKTILQFPVTYNSTFTDTSVLISVSEDVGDSLRYEAFTESRFVFDAWGTLNLPLGALPVIRLFKAEASTYLISTKLSGEDEWEDGLPFSDTTYYHIYYSNDPSVKLPVLEYLTNFNGTSNSGEITFLSETQYPLAVLSSKEPLKFMVFPNPSTDIIQVLSATPIEQATLTDLNGKTVLSSTLNGNNTLQIGHLAQGTYTLSVLTNGAWTSQTIQKF